MTKLATSSIRVKTLILTFDCVQLHAIEPVVSEDPRGLHHFLHAEHDRNHFVQEVSDRFLVVDLYATLKGIDGAVYSGFGDKDMCVLPFYWVRYQRNQLLKSNTVASVIFFLR